MKKAVCHSIMAVVVVLGLTLSMATPVVAQEQKIRVEKHTDLPTDHEYEVGDTIQYVLNVTNIHTVDTIVLTGVWDTLPDGTVETFVDPSDPGQTLTLTPGESMIYYCSYIVSWDDLEWITPPVGDPYWGVTNRFEAADWPGYPGGEAEEHGWVTVISVVSPPDYPVGGVASPVSRLVLMAPWIVLAGAIIGAAVFVWSRRAQGRA